MTMSDLDAEGWTALKWRCLEQVLSEARQRVWQHDRFELHTSTARRAPWHTKKQGQLPPFLWGQVTFTDNVEDEWMVVRLLLELTRAIPTLCARCAGVRLEELYYRVLGARMRNDWRSYCGW